MVKVLNCNTLKNGTIKNDTIILNSNSVINNVNFENSILTTKTNIENVVIQNCSFKNCRILLENIKNLLVYNNKINSPLLIDNDPAYINNKGEQSVYARGLELINCDIIIVNNNTISNCIGEGILIQNVGKNQYNIITNNLIELLDVSKVNTNLEAIIFLRNNKDGYITITENIVGNNIPNPNQTNRCDGIEINLNRGKNYAGSEAFIDNVAGSSNKPTILTVNITRNSILNLGGSADGIDLNVGNYGILYINVLDNTISNAGDEGLTLDTYGPNIKIVGKFDRNYFSTTGSKGAKKDKEGNLIEDGNTDGIKLTLSELVKGTTMKNDKVDLDFNFIISNNKIIADSLNLAGTNEKPQKADAIQINAGKGINTDLSGKIKLYTYIVNNNSKTRAGSGLNMSFLEKAKNIELDCELNIVNNNFLKTNNAFEAGEPYTDKKNIGKFTLLENAINSTIKGKINLENNTFEDVKNDNPIVSIINESTSDNVKDLKINYIYNNGAKLETNID
jgi:hypothetical protein